MDTGPLKLRLYLDTEELIRDMEKLEDGTLTLPTVSAVSVEIEGIGKEEVTIWLAEK